MFQEKTKSLHDTLKQKEGEGSKNSRPVKDGLIILEKDLALKM